MFGVGWDRTWMGWTKKGITIKGHLDHQTKQDICHIMSHIVTSDKVISLFLFDIS